MLREELGLNYKLRKKYNCWMHIVFERNGSYIYWGYETKEENVTLSNACFVVGLYIPQGSQGRS